MADQAKKFKHFEARDSASACQSLDEPLGLLHTFELQVMDLIKTETFSIVQRAIRDQRLISRNIMYIQDRERSVRG